MPGKSLPPFPGFPGFPGGGCWGGPKSQHGKRGKMKLLVTETGLDEQGSKVNSEQPGKRGKCGKIELLDTNPLAFPALPCWGLTTLPALPCWGLTTPFLELVSVTRSSIFPRFPHFPGCSKSIFPTRSSGLFSVTRSFIFPHFPCWLFVPSQHPPGKPGKRGNRGKTCRG